MPRGCAEVAERDATAGNLSNEAGVRVEKSGFRGRVVDALLAVAEMLLYHLNFEMEPPTVSLDALGSDFFYSAGRRCETRTRPVRRESWGHTWLP